MKNTDEMGTYELWSSFTNAARIEIYGFDEMKTVTCAKGLGPYGAGCCEHFDCILFEKELKQNAN